MNVAIIKYNAGNIQSVLFALERLGINALVTDNVEEIKRADKVIFPGVGEASSAMQNLKENGLDAVIKELKQPVIGICVGMQLLCSASEENNAQCLGIIPVHVKKFLQGTHKLKVPQVGWNTIYALKSPLFKNVPEQSFIYNVHSFYAEDSAFTIARCDYGVSYSAAVKKNNFYGVQFHTEKSGAIGDQIIKNFLAI